MIAILDSGSNKVPSIEKAVDEFMDFITFPILDFNPDLSSSFIGIIISGAPLLITEMDIMPYLEKTKWIKEIDIPILGICFGHQLIGLNYGAFGSMMREDRNWHEIEILADDPIFNRMPNVTEMMEDHCETISIPPNFKLLASSDSCINEVMKHNKKALYGVQFHPEVSGNMGRVLIENFVKICEDKANGHSDVER
jgi:GMP synthase (glutamine-hydrolysing)